MWIVYYTTIYCYNLRLVAKGETVPRLVYYKENGSLNWSAISGILIRGSQHLTLICFSYLSLHYANLAGISTGVITSLYTSGIIFVAILYYVVYGERLTFRDCIGIFIIIVGGVFIGIGKPSQDSVEHHINEDDQSKNMLLSIFFALNCGLSFAVNALVMKYYVQNFNYGVIQLNLDGYMVCVPFLLIGYLVYGS